MMYAVSAVLLAAVVLLVWYIFNLLKRLTSFLEEVEEMSTILNDFSEHVERISKMDTFYGDETIEALLTHSKEVTKNITQVL